MVVIDNLLAADLELMNLRRANASRKGGDWYDDDFDGIRRGRIYRVNRPLLPTHRNGHAPTLDDAQTAFNAQYEAWESDQ